MQLEHKQNLIKLADWLEAHGDGLNEIELDDGRIVTFDMEIYSNTYEDVCGTAGCAIGWATCAIERRQRLPGRADYESWGVFANRLFGTYNFGNDAGVFMFGGDWHLWPEQNTVKATVARIRYVLEHEDAPDEWEGWDGFLGEVVDPNEVDTDQADADE